jgi:hypothetical protein
MTAPPRTPRTVTELHQVAEHVAAIAAKSGAVAEAVDRARFQLQATDQLAIAAALHGDLDLDLDLDPTLAPGFDRARYLSGELERNLRRAVKRARSIDHALQLDAAFDDEVANALEDAEPERARDLVRLVCVVVRLAVRWFALQARFVVRGAATDFSLDDAHRSAWGVRDALSILEVRVWALLAEAQGRAAGAGSASVVELAAQRVLEVALSIVPVSKRPRYREEFIGELHALAAAQASGRAQLAYACVVAWRMWSLQRALRSTASAPSQERVR